MSRANLNLNRSYYIDSHHHLMLSHRIEDDMISSSLGDSVWLGQEILKGEGRVDSLGGATLFRPFTMSFCALLFKRPELLISTPNVVFPILSSHKGESIYFDQGYPNQ